MTPKPVDGDAFDYVIVGAGTAGCVLANRLAAEMKCTVCLLEAGPPDHNIFLRVPAGVYKASDSPKYAWQFETEPNEATVERRISIPQGKTLGGSSAINGMVYNRGCADDYDSWADRGNRGWSYADVLPYFKRSERRICTSTNSYRGSNGSLLITDPDWRHPLCDAFMEAACSLGLPRNPDYNGASQRGVSYYQRYIEKGWRISAARAFLRPIANQENVDVRTQALVTAVLIDGKRAYGVRYNQGRGRPDRFVKARREVILCAGAINTPKLLQISGIGSPTLLAGLGIPIAHALPAVGENLQDHYMTHFIVRVNQKTLNGRGIGLVSEATKWMLGRPSILAGSPSLVCGFANSRDFSDTPDIQLDLALGNYTNLVGDRFPIIKLGFYQLRPKSTGFVRTVSADPNQPPTIQPNYLVAEEDQRVAIDGSKAVRRLLAAPELAPYYCAEEEPGPSVNDDSGYLQFAREAGLTSYHVCGSCRMGPSTDPSSVVDDQLRVHGLDGLRIADASIMPGVPSANTSAAVFMIAEKASDLILQRQALPAMPLDHPRRTPRQLESVSAA